MAVQPEAVPGTEKPSTFSKEELLSEITQMVSQQMNAAITQRNSAFEKKMEAMISKLVPQTHQEEDVPAPKVAKLPNAEILAMKQQLDAIKAEKDAEVNKRKETELRTNVREHLTKMGVAPHLIKAAIATLVSEDKLVGYTTEEYATDKDRMVFRSKPGPLGEEDLSTGLSKWIKSEEGSGFLSPRGAQGSGDRSYSGKLPTSKQPLSNQSLADMIMEARNNP